jgi:cell division protein FtsW (lipid II flippase)
VANLKRFIPLGIGLAILLFFGFSFFNPDFIQQRVDSFVGRWNNSPPHLFIQNQFSFALENQGGFLGQGLGKGTNGTRVFGPVSLIETFHPKVFFEIGYLGFFAFMGFVTYLTILAFKSYRSVGDRTLRGFGSSLWVFILIISYLPYWYPLDTDPVALYYWLFAGIIFKLPEIDKQEQAALKVIEEGEPVQKKQLLTSKRR